ncbi:two-component system sensor histidine kinase/response regulator [Brasilonema octagenarum UFV-E1]|uniref:Circadian input-output histidine kinase CikA n=1 Tax=Brasilonema sennae CENA114 TaxID=415709 RepID=A0A856M8G5_9CYAN|nr:response regulator [Brasilonema sennae]QDL06680.1 two-component system sensor histidine kinase/response regulator [Brasilonema sennae CENA114]QDL13048.1 two-component system sensor histidine kinase/response regulator [Brasilonema octagenarum UFV-E1]
MLNNLTIGKKIGASVGFGLTMLVAIGVLSYQATKHLIESSSRESHTYQVVGQLNNLTYQLKNAEKAQEIYLLTGDKRYLQSYTTAIQVIEKSVKSLRTLTADNMNQQRRIDVLQPELQKKIATMQSFISLRDTQVLNAVRQQTLTNNGNNSSNEIRRIMLNMESEERYLLEQRSRQTQAATHQAMNTITYGIPLAFVLLTLIGIYLSRNISKPLQELSQVTEKLAMGDLSVSTTADNRRDEIGTLAQAFNEMIANLRQTTQTNNEQNWLKSNLAKFSQMLQGQRSLETVASIILSELAPLVNVQHGVFYIMDSVDEQPMLKLIGSYAYQQRKHLSNRFSLGEGLVGQCALEKQKIILTDVPSDYIHISSGLGEAKPLNIIVLPVLFENQVTAVIELASFQRFGEIYLIFLEQVTQTIGVVLNIIAADIRTQELLQKSQALTQQLQVQQEELKHSNKILEEQAQTLQASEELLKQQQEELQQSNEELQELTANLEEKAELLSTQKKEVERKNQQLEETRQSLEEKAEQLALSSKYKSEFLANMSHELRTPLNSLLILANLLADNVEGNLSAKQVEYSRTIHSAGRDLLVLINDILDLAKIESGTMSININQMLFLELRDSIESIFRQVAIDKKLSFTIELAPELPTTIETDVKCLQQVLKNLLANAFKFTERGEVSLRMFVANQGWSSDEETLNSAPMVIAFAVKDTGIGIASQKQKIIFEAFQQADGSTSRKYEGTGLGLSISRKITEILGGEIKLESHLGQGSTFTLYLPQAVGGRDREMESSLSLSLTPSIMPNFEAQTRTPDLPSPLIDDRGNILQGDRLLIIVEDDLMFARILLDMARQKGFKVILAHNGSTGLRLVQEFQPSAVILDIRLPEMDGWTVLDRLKHDPSVRHIPVHIMTVEEGRQRGLQQGAIAYLQKPVSNETLQQALTKMKGFVDRSVKNLLIVEDDSTQRYSIVELIGNGDVETTGVATGAEALAAIRSQHYDCMVLDLGLPDMSGFELIEQIKQQPNGEALPIIIYTARELTRAEDTQLRRIAETIIVKDVRSPERLLDETALFLHRVQANLPIPKQQMLEQLQSSDPVLAGQKVLIVDDDVRNIFALTSMLERYQMQVLYAENGKDGIEVLQNNPDIDMVLMDMMMPELDGYQTTRLIRQNNQFKSLPIIALTAKAMQSDRDKCIEAGASDYISKPVDTEQLVSLLRVWLYR